MGISVKASIKTKNYISDRLVKLSEKKRLSKISVTDLCKECDINRSTFYYHFKDIQDVIHWIYHTEASVPVREKILSSGNPKDTSFVTRDILRNLYSRHSFYTQAIRIEGQNSLEEYILAEAKENWALIFDKRLEESNIQKSDLHRDTLTLIEAALEYYCYGHYILTVNWLKRGMDVEPDRLAELMDTVALQGFDKVMEIFT